ncbi:MAG: hypothetical protein P8Q14_08650, partial [Vicingaceae bacterium]|nr:hypothetical protein [Vicingaceae bacterium]
MKKLLLFASIFCLTTGAFAQEETKVNNKKRFNHSLGFGAGISTGHGLSYRYFGKKLGVQVNFSPYKDEYKTNISSGVTFLYRLVELNEFTFFLYQGNHYYFNEESHTYTDYDYDYNT